MPSKSGFQDLMGQLAAGFCIVGILSGIGLLAWQCYIWLRFGYWTSVSALQALRWFELSWALSPRDWFGAYAVLDWVPLALALPILGVALMGVVVLLASE